mmetsp:Transcript_9465/g.27849  ORF Transcript_9465/g.27849 Transcript_9465/m.27849 type:complete len:325 (-) Transcript_9465:1176-2150(-)
MRLQRPIRPRGFGAHPDLLDALADRPQRVPAARDGDGVDVAGHFRLRRVDADEHAALAELANDGLHGKARHGGCVKPGADLEHDNLLVGRDELVDPRYHAILLLLVLLVQEPGAATHVPEREAAAVGAPGHRPGGQLAALRVHLRDDLVEHAPRREDRVRAAGAHALVEGPAALGRVEALGVETRAREAVIHVARVHEVLLADGGGEDVLDEPVAAARREAEAHVVHVAGLVAPLRLVGYVVAVEEPHALVGGADAPAAHHVGVGGLEVALAPVNVGTRRDAEPRSGGDDDGVGLGEKLRGAAQRRRDGQVADLGGQRRQGLGL